MAISLASVSPNRFLIFLSYLGHEFRGMQKQKPVLVSNQWKEVPTVQNVLEDTLKLVLKPYHDVHVFTSSRTDAGVHALRSSVHVDLHMTYPLKPERVTSELNKHFVQRNMGLRIISSHLVPSWFSSRNHAMSRTYLYRFACRKEPRPDRDKFLDEIPFSEHGRALFLQLVGFSVDRNSNLDVDKMREAASLLEGTNNFICFMSKSLKKPPDLATIRTIYSLTIKPGKPFMPEHDPHSDLYNYWEVVCHGKSFLYRQVRRIVGALLAVGYGKIQLSTVQHMIDNPVPESWDERAICVPPWGLYLLDVAYNPLHFYTFDEPDNLDGRMTQALGY